MSLSIYNARLLDPASGFDGVGAVYVKDGVIVSVDACQVVAHADAQTSVDARGLCLAPA